MTTHLLEVGEEFSVDEVTGTLVKGAVHGDDITLGDEFLLWTGSIRSTIRKKSNLTFKSSILRAPTALAPSNASGRQI